MSRTPDDNGRPVVVPQPRTGSEVIYATHNLCDETTWFSESLRRTDKALVDSGDGLTWTSGDPCWIDMTHGKIFNEDRLAADQEVFDPGNPHSYVVVVSVDGVELTQRTPFELSGGDYTVDYVTGEVTFAVSQAGKAVTASYSYKGGSGWILQPLQTKSLIIEKAEIQFSVDIEMTAAFVMEVWAYADIFAPHLLTTADPPGPLPPGTRIPIEHNEYKTIDQIIDEAVQAFPGIPVLGGARGYTQPRQVFQFHYAAVRGLYSSLGMQLRISIAGGSAFIGERATATFYCTSAKDAGVEESLRLLTAD